MMLNESKRDDLLLPYYNMLLEKGFKFSLGRFKGIMLDKLAAQGGMHNLSKASNFYLAGAVRYYFNGDLTLNKNLSILTGDPNATDQWNVEVCRRLDALIDILRNALIDSVGETWEQPEDFGDLPINKLLRKYGRKIDIALGIDSGKKREKKEAEPEVIDTNVGNGYTFDILYNYGDATKYERFTAPGAWCITYGQGHYNHYKNWLKIHYVIFLKNGYENVPRRTGKGYTKQKPHDEYGNSMIALLQSDNDWRPIYITSRWNHGYGETSGTEADHAYTLDEFCKITGVTPEDLKRIYDIWKREAPKHGEKRGHREVDPEEKAKKLEFLRRLKYVQMRINGGEDPNGLLEPVEMFYGKMPDRGPDNKWMPVNFRNCVLRCRLKINEEEGEENNSMRACFLVDKGKIVFETIVEGTNTYEYTMETAEKYYQNTRYDTADDHTSGRLHNLIIFQGNSGGYKLYDTRQHGFIKIGGTGSFQCIPKKWASNYGSGALPRFMQVKMSIRDIALISLSNNMPLKLPNGQYWFNDMCCVTIRSNRDSYRRGLDAQFAGTKDDGLIEIIYDESSGEKYFYSVKTGRFVNLPGGDVMGEKYASYIPHVLYNNLGSNFSLIEYQDPIERYKKTSRILLNTTTLERIKIGPFDKFSNIVADENTETNVEVLRFTPDCPEGYAGYKGRGMILFDTSCNKFLKINGDYLSMSSNNGNTDGKFLCYRDSFYKRGDDGLNYCVYFNIYYDTIEKAIVKNPYNYPGPYQFETGSIGRNDSDKVYVFKKAHRRFDWRDASTTNPEYMKYLAVVNINDMPSVKIDGEEQQWGANNEVPQPAVQLSEGRIKAIVAETLKRILGDGK